MYYLSNSSAGKLDLKKCLKKRATKAGGFCCLTFSHLCEGLILVLLLLAQPSVHFIACSKELRCGFVKSSREALGKKNE